MVKKELPSPPLNEAETKILLAPHEIVRDPLHEDITITALERVIIDTLAFQRLRSLNQLGPTHLVYPGATHTRFMHSLGTLHCVEQMIQIANMNYSVYSQPSLLLVEPYPHLLARLFALLHDVAHMPYGHTLEDEGNLADPEWEDKERADLWLGLDKEIPKAILEFLVNSSISPAAAERVVNDIRRYVLFKDDPMDLDYPFVIDLVGNTLCADLLDYLDRDMYFCGLRERSGDRVVKYVAIARVHRKTKEAEELLPSDESGIGKGRVVLLTYRFEHEHLAGGNLKVVSKPEILSEAIDLLRRRFILAEKVYFHRTKLAASALLISATGSSSLKLREIYDLSDSEFISRLSSDTDPRVQQLIKAYKSRNLYKSVYQLNYREERDTDPQSKILWREKYQHFRNPLWRKEKEGYLETYSDLPPGSIVIYCPDRNMNLKEFEMLVQSQSGGEIKPLENILDRNRRLEMDAINQRYAQIWSLHIFIDPQSLDVSNIANEAVQNLSALCETVIGFPNDITALQGKGLPLRNQVASRVIREWNQANKGKVPHTVYEELVHASHRDEEANLLEAFRKHLKASMGSKQLQLDVEQNKK